MAATLAELIRGAHCIYSSLFHQTVAHISWSSRDHTPRTVEAN